MPNYSVFMDPIVEKPKPVFVEAPLYKVEKIVYDITWLANILLGVSENKQMPLNIINILHTQNDASIQNMLFDMLGVEGFDIISEIISHSAELKENTIYFIDQVKDTKPQHSIGANVSSKFSVSTTSQREEAKLHSKEQKKVDKFLKSFDIKDSYDNGLDIINKSRLEEQASIFTSGHLEYNPIANKIALPEGTVRQMFKGYESVSIPPLESPDLKHKIDLIPISYLDPIIQSCFSEKSLNRLQTICYPSAYLSNENLLVCAPTGAGKTNVALLTVLRELEQQDDLTKADFKIVYVAPMKALAQEIVEKFSKKLKPLGVKVRELTGDMQMSKNEILETHLIVTTPEKWDVVTRKSGEGALVNMVRLLIVDEVHLLHEERGAVIETIIARTLRMVESSQQMIRIVGLSATLPNCLDVAEFLHVNVESGLLFFDSSYRPVPLSQTYIGCTESNPLVKRQSMNEICYKQVLKALQQDFQVMVFVHSRKETVGIAKYLREQLKLDDKMDLVDCSMMPPFKHGMMELNSTKNAEMRDLYQSGIGFHNAGMLRSDRNFVENYFSNGCIRLLVCTATLAWGVNLPAHTVIIKGTEVYDSKKGGFFELSMLDVMQIFGRAGRPQFDSFGEAILITTHEKLTHYLHLLNHALPIESTLINSLENNLNAEIISGSVTNMHEAIQWLSYTYLFIRMQRNPLVYGVTWEGKVLDPTLHSKRQSLLESAAITLHKTRMIRYDPNSGNFFPTDLGRVASYYYIHHLSIEAFNEKMTPYLTDEEIVDLIAGSKEFTQLKFREEELGELETLKSNCMLPVGDFVANQSAKANVLLQMYISNNRVDSFTLISDQNYISQSAGRIARGLFEIALKRGWTVLASRLLDFTLMIDKRVWDVQHPLRQFKIKADWGMKLDKSNLTIESIRSQSAAELGAYLNLNTPIGAEIRRLAQQFPMVDLECKVQPITRTVLQLDFTLKRSFKFVSGIHGTGEPFWLWIEDADGQHIYHTEYVIVTKSDSEMEFKFTVPVLDPPPAQYVLVAVSDRWLGARTIIPVSFQHLIMPESRPPNTSLLNLTPLPLAVLNNSLYESLYKFSHFNPVQTQAFHTLYHTDINVLLGAPTGSGKTITAEICMFRLFNLYPAQKIIYVAPLKALAKERILDWSTGLCKVLNKKVIELTGDVTPDTIAINSADIIVTTPEKWDGISRDWKHRNYVKKVGLVILDEIHLLGTDRGPVLEIIVSRMRYIAESVQSLVRIVGLSTALANAGDLADWLGIKTAGLFNFPASVRPVPLTVHISGFPGKHYCPRMATMNKPTYAAITTYSPTKPVLVFVSSRRQTRLTAMDLISYTATDGNPKKWLKVDHDIIEVMIADVIDEPLKHCLSFGIGIHHAGLKEEDRKLVEKLFVEQHIQILICTSTLAWGVNFPAHLVVVKGTEYYDAHTHRYIDYPITDVLQMMGRAGRPQFDTEGRACILVHEPKKVFYRKFLYEPFPVESSLHLKLHNHINAEIASGSIASIQDGIDFLSWTYYFRRLIQNPSYYGLNSNEPIEINKHLTDLLKKVYGDLNASGCITIDGELDLVNTTALGKIASYYYLKYQTLELFNRKIEDNLTVVNLLFLLTDAFEFEDMPVRHNEELLNEELATAVPHSVDKFGYSSPHVKTCLLLQSHLSHLKLPISDYITDTKSVLDQTLRVIHAMIDVAVDRQYLQTTLNLINVMQMIIQARWFDDSTLINLPSITKPIIDSLSKHFNMPDISLPELMSINTNDICKFLKTINLGENQIANFKRVYQNLPNVDVDCKFSTVPSSFTIKLAITLKLQRESKFKSIKAFTPYFPKPKEEGYWLVVGVENELLYFKRITLLKEVTNLDVAFTTEFTGLDQEYSFEIDI